MIHSITKYIGASSSCISGFTTRSGGYLDGLSVYEYKDFKPLMKKLAGNWKLIKSYNPTHQTSVTERITVGVMKTSSRDTSHSWGAQIKASYSDAFWGIGTESSLSSNYEGYVNVKNILIEESEKEIEKTVIINPGESTALWQWRYMMEINGVTAEIPTDITWTTNSPGSMPPIPADVKSDK